MIYRLTLLSDGPSDRVLLPAIMWTLGEHSDCAFEPQFADLRLLPHPPKQLLDKVQLALQHWPCDLLCVHRDAEAQDPEWRHREIIAAVQDHLHVPVVPVRMQEAWLLHDEVAIRQAAGRPRGTEPLPLPPLARVEDEPHPKAILHAALRAAHAAKGRRGRKFRVERAVHDLADHIKDWTPLRQLSAFRRFEDDLIVALRALGVETH